VSYWPWPGRDLLQLIDTEHMRLTQTTFVHRDFRHVESDIVLEAPRRQTGRREPSKLLVYIPSPLRDVLCEFDQRENGPRQFTF